MTSLVDMNTLRLLEAQAYWVTGLIDSSSLAQAAANEMQAGFTGDAVTALAVASDKDRAQWRQLLNAALSESSLPMLNEIEAHLAVGYLILRRVCNDELSPIVGAQLVYGLPRADEVLALQASLLVALLDEAERFTQYDDSNWDARWGRRPRPADVERQIKTEACKIVAEIAERVRAYISDR
jgi:hypothetical protein